MRYRKEIAIQWLLYLLISASDDFSSKFQFRGYESEKREEFEEQMKKVLQ